MKISPFPESNAKIVPGGICSEPDPHGLDHSTPVFVAKVQGGVHDGIQISAFCWELDGGERKRLAEGGKVFVAFFGPSSPHRLGVTLGEALGSVRVSAIVRPHNGN